MSLIFLVVHVILVLVLVLVTSQNMLWSGLLCCELNIFCVCVVGTVLVIDTSGP
jgi:hypothetical protein